MKIQEATFDRVVEITDIIVTYYNEINFTVSMDIPRLTTQVVLGIESEDEQILLAIDDNNKVIGIAWSLLQQPFFSHDWMVDNMLIYVLKEKRGSMVGPRLMKGIRKWAEKSKVKMVTIGTISEINTDRTKGFYAKMGYREVGAHFISEI